MNMEYMEFGSTPYGEDCTQVGVVDYSSKATKEMKAYINQLNRLFPESENMGINFKIKWFSHDFGSYGEVCCYWNTDDEIADGYVYVIERNLPENWDEEAKKELGI